MTEINEGMWNNTCSRFAVRSAVGDANGSLIATSPISLRQASARRAGRRQQGALGRGWILYDGECGFCVGMAYRFAKAFHRRGFEFLSLQTPWLARRLGLVSGTRPDEMRVLTSDGSEFGGAEAVVFLARQIWWMWPLFALTQLPGMSRVFDRGYRWVAAHRRCGSDSACNIRHALVGGHRPPLQQASLLMIAGPLAVVRCLRGLLLRRLFWVYGCFIVLTIIAFAALTFRHAGAMAAGEPVARSLCAFIAVFWAARLLVQFFVFDARPFLTNSFLRLGYHALAIAFVFLVFVCGKAVL